MRTRDVLTLKALRRRLRPLKRWFNRVIRIDAGIFLSKPISVGPEIDLDRSQVVVDMTDAPIMSVHCSLPKIEFEKRIASGHKFYEFWVNSEPVGYNWMASPGSRIGVLHDLMLLVPEKALYLWDGVTEPKHRGKGYLAAMIDGILALNSAETNIAWTAVAVGNHSSRRALAKAGFSPMFTYVSAQLFGKTLVSLVFSGGRVSRAQPVFDRLSQAPCLALR